jgi:hypothetical protein
MAIVNKIIKGVYHYDKTVKITKIVAFVFKINIMALLR